MLNPFMIIAGLGLLGASMAVGSISKGLKKGKPPKISKQSVFVPAINSYNIPELASGAVIPPNRKFLAVLGDQTNGTNIEAPVSEIENAVARGMGQSGGSMSTELLRSILEVLKAGKVMVVGEQEFARLVYNSNKSESNRVGISLVRG